MFHVCSDFKYSKLYILIIFEWSMSHTLVIQNDYLYFSIPVQYLYNNGKILISDVCCKRRLDIGCTLAV